VALVALPAVAPESIRAEGETGFAAPPSQPALTTANTSPQARLTILCIELLTGAFTGGEYVVTAERIVEGRLSNGGASSAPLANRRSRSKIAALSL
jgi:hypothetical protein